MVRYENQCVDCHKELGCTRPYCRYWNVPVWVCDRCKEENVDLYEVDGEEVCAECALKMLPMIHRE